MAIVPLSLCLTVCLFSPLESGKYLEDYDFIVNTVARKGAAVRTRGIDWKTEAARLRPLFESCRDSADHVRNVMRLLAVLGDAHSGVTDPGSVAWDDLPKKFDGLFGGGLWLGWDEGRIVLRGVMEGHPLADKVPVGSMRKDESLHDLKNHRDKSSLWADS